ncbi:hypothetical protein FB451DRAFT_1206108 [Mycena latifolia]|nr:hypothetical protein FB451DRAFT_1206108 [Mycena latifolia]
MYARRFLFSVLSFCRFVVSFLVTCHKYDSYLVYLPDDILQVRRRYVARFSPPVLILCHFRVLGGVNWVPGHQSGSGG